MLKFLKFIPMFLLIFIIFLMSHQTGVESTNSSNAILEYVINFSPFSKNITSLIIRKSAHIFEYSLLTLCVYYAFSDIKFKHYSLLLVLFITLSFAITDEIHQLYVIGRSGSIFDVMIDSIGILIIIYLIKKRTS